ncbi:hypothetical protein LguiA_021969 [Lonicera macranthoides]
MADGVFGTAIDIETLKGMPQYRNMTIRRSDMAKEARDLMNAEGKDTICRQYVDDLSNSYGTGVKTLCTIYNATGDDLTFVLSHDWHGHVGEKPYPMVRTEIREDGHYKIDYWGLLFKKLEDSSKTSRDTNNGCTSSMSIGSGEAPGCMAILSLTGPDPPYMPKPGH